MSAQPGRRGVFRGALTSRFGRIAVIGTLLGALTTGTGVAATAASAAPIDDAVSAGVAHAAEQGITSYVSVVDRVTGAVAAETANAHTQVASESVMKLFIAAHYAVQAGGYQQLTESRRSRLEYMIEYSDDATASALFTSEIVPGMAARYGLTETANAADYAGHWGAARITAHDMAAFLFRMGNDPQVGPWLLGVMAKVAPNGSDGFNQAFGFNALSGDHGSKQGWGSDNWTSQPNAVHSVGYTADWYAAVLQTGGSGTYRPMRDTATYTAQLIQQTPRRSPDDPLGSVDGSGLSGVVVRLNGWALDPNDATKSIAVDVYDSGPQGTGAQRVQADEARPDVNSALAVSGEHGWSLELHLNGSGDHRVCAYAINEGAGIGNPALGCRTYSLPANPVGALDSLSLKGLDLTISGWAWDADSPSTPLVVHVYDQRQDGSAAVYALAGSAVERPDVSAAFAGVGEMQGFSATFPLTTDGSRQVCAYAINAGPGENALLGCTSLLAPIPFGALDEVLGSVGQIFLAGWALNPNAPNEAAVVHVYDTVGSTISGPYVLSAGEQRNDVDAAFGLGDAHGYSGTIPAVPGQHQVCTYAIDSTGSSNPLIGCRSVTVS